MSWVSPLTAGPEQDSRISGAAGATGGTPEFGWKVLTGNDAQNWVELSGFTQITTIAGSTQESGAVRGAFLRIACSLILTGGIPEDVGFVTFEVTGNVLRSSG